MKQITNKSSILAITLIFGIGAMSACGSTEISANNQAASKTAHGNSANDKENKATENKATANQSVAAKQAKLVEVFDGRAESKKSETLKADRNFAEQAVLSRLVMIKQTGAAQNAEEDIECTIDNFNLDGVGEGAFTKPNSSQKIYLYRLCEGGVGSMPTRLGGIMIAENGKVIAHYVYKELGGYAGMKTLPDINQNGLSEIVLQPVNMVNQGYFTASIELVEMSANGLTKMGDALVFSNSPDTGETGYEAEQSGSSTAYKISVQTGKTPVFLRETYHRKTDDEKWQLKTKATKFSPENAGSNKPIEYFKSLK